MKHEDLTIFGTVQGVYFRQEAKRRATELNVFGFVKNNPDGSVSIEVEGENLQVDKFISWANMGPMGATVERMERKLNYMSGYTAFDIKY